MNKNLLIRYIRGHCSSEEAARVLDWVGQSEQNARYFSRLMNLWVSQNMPSEEASDQEMARMRELIDSKEHKPRRRGIFFPRAALWLGAACIVVLAAALIRVSMRPAPAVPIAGDLSVPSTRMFYTDKGVKGKVVLPDSSVVWLNSDSRLWYPDSFGRGKREVVLSGEGYFDVTHDPQHPMVVNTPKNFRVEVLGTTFNLKSYENDETAVATLYSGSVHIIMDDSAKGGSQVRVLKPNESITIFSNNTTRLASIDSPGKYSSWKEGRMIFEAAPMREVIKILERWHGVEFSVADPEVLDYRLTAQFGSESIVQIMDLVRMTSFIDYRIKDKTVFLKKR